MAELEEHICSLVTYSAFKKDDPNAAISAIPLTQLNHKEFGKKELDVSLHSNTNPPRLSRSKHQTLKVTQTQYWRGTLTNSTKNNTRSTFRKSSRRQQTTTTPTVKLPQTAQTQGVQLEVAKALLSNKKTSQGNYDSGVSIVLLIKLIANILLLKLIYS